MQRRYWKGLMIAVAILALVSTGTLTGCTKKVDPGTSTTAPDQGSSGTVEKAPQASTPEANRFEGMTEEEIAAMRQKEEEARIAREKARMDHEAMLRFNKDNILFAFDSSDLSPEAMSILKDKAIYLRKNPAKGVLIKGHCDERGSAEYNLALGDRRANSAKNFLKDLGIDARRINTISYGEEQPAEHGHDEASWAANRRCEFALE